MVRTMSLQKRGPHKKTSNSIFDCALIKCHLYPELNSLSDIKEQLFGNKTVFTCGMFFKSGITHRGINRNPRALAPFFGNTGFYLHANTLFITGCNG